MPLPRIWLNFFSPTTLRRAITRGVKGPFADTLPMFKANAPDFLSVATYQVPFGRGPFSSRNFKLA